MRWKILGVVQKIQEFLIKEHLCVALDVKCLEEQNQVARQPNIQEYIECCDLDEVHKREEQKKEAKAGCNYNSLRTRHVFQRLACRLNLLNHLLFGFTHQKHAISCILFRKNYGRIVVVHDSNWTE